MSASIFSESQVIKHCFKTSSAYKRTKWDFCTKQADIDHYEVMCDCDLTFKLFGSCIDPFNGYVSRYDGPKQRTGEEMILAMLGYINYMYVKFNGFFRYRKNVLTLGQRRALYMMSKLGPNMKTLPLVIGSNYPRAKEPGVYWSELPLILMYVDAKRFGMSVSELLVNVFQQNDDVQGPILIGAGSEGYQTYVSQSYYNQNYGHTLINGVKYPAIVHATENVYEKLPKALAKMNKNPKYSPEIADFMKRKCSSILSMLFSPYFLDVDKYFGKFTWKYDSHTMNSIVQDDMKKDASAGVYFSHTVTHTNPVNGKTYRIGNRHATKGEVGQTVGENIDRIFNEFLRGHEVEMPASFTRGATKAEPFATFGKSQEDVIKLCNKVRIFHICDTFSYLASMSVDYLRVHIEKGNMIKIGMNWYKGGAQHIAEYMHYLKKMIYGTGDVTGLDLSLLAPLISLYYAAGVHYYDLKTFAVEMRALFLWIRKNVSIHMHQHLSQLFGSLVVWLNGMIASGHYLTSHADSWCMAFLFVAFIFW